MTDFYYKNNEVLMPKWTSPEAAAKRPWALILGCLAIALLGLGAWLWWWVWPEQNAQKSTVVIFVDYDGDGNPDVQGTGVFINSKGYVLTNKHVIQNKGKQPKAVKVLYLPGSTSKQEMDATIEKMGEGDLSDTPEHIKNDWAVLRVATNKPVTYVPLSDKTDFKEEESLKVYGYPLGWTVATNPYGPSVKVLHGILNRADRSAQGGVVRLTHSCKSAPGMSGGPVTEWGQVIGLNTAGLVDVVDPNENYAIPIYLIRDHLKDFLP